MNVIGRSMPLKEIWLFLLKDRNPTLSFLASGFYTIGLTIQLTLDSSSACHVVDMQ